MNRLVCFGLGYSARVIARRLQAKGWGVLGTTRSADGAQSLRNEGFEVQVYSGTKRDAGLGDELKSATHVLLSIAPGSDGDTVLTHYGDDLARAGSLGWIGYLSTVGVYGDHGGEWVDEASVLNPRSERSVRRAKAERDWLGFGAQLAKPVHLFRLAGIYGPGRGPLENVLAGKARRINKSGQVFNRIHVEDIATIVEASIDCPRGGAIYNVSDNEPAPPQDVVAHACELLGKEPPPEIAIEDAGLTPMGLSFYGENKRVSNRLVREELGVTLAYPTYREGLAALVSDLE